jgi:DHA2 family multidrug resistance protein
MDLMEIEKTESKIEEWRPKHNRALITIAVMLPTFIEVLDTSIANVAMPHIAGNLSASNHEATWVLTSYLVANAIILPTGDWFSKLFGRKRFLIASTVLFTVFSALCGFAGSLGFLILSRIFQGFSGGALQPLSQAIMMESFPKEKRGFALAIFGAGVIIAPIIGPILGGWLTDNFSWRWIFLINIPLGAIGAVLLSLYVEDPPYLERNPGKIDYIGFGFMAVGLGLLQVVLDKGQDADWFSASWICWSTVILIISLTAFVFWELREKNPIVNLRVLKNKNFSVGIVVVTIVGALLYGALTILTLYYQTIMQYTAFLGGVVLVPQGVGMLTGCIVVGRLSGKVDDRITFACGLIFMVAGNCMLMNVNPYISMGSMLFPITLGGAGQMLAFISVMTLAMGTLENKEVGNASGLFNLMRNIGGSVGISMVTTILARSSQVHQSLLVGHITPYDSMYQLAVRMMGAAKANGLIYQELMRQSAVLAYIDCFQTFSVMAAFCLLALFLFKKVQSHGQMMIH